MRKVFHTAVLALALASLPHANAAQYAQLTIDGTSQETFARSMVEMRNSLSTEAEREQLGKGILRLLLERYPPAQAAEGFSKMMLLGEASKVSHITLDGTALAELMEAGAEGETEKRVGDKAFNPQACLESRVSIGGAKIDADNWGDDLIGQVSNALPWPVGYISLTYKVFSEGRGVPWIKGENTFFIGGGVEPGETVEHLLDNVYLPETATRPYVLEVTIKDVADANQNWAIQDGRLTETDCSQPPTPLFDPITNSERSAAPSGPPLTNGEKMALGLSVQKCWNVGSLSSEALKVTVTIAVSMSVDGKPQASSIELVSSSDGTNVAALQAYEAARRAIIRCGAKGFDLPRGNYSQWKTIELTFDPKRMTVK